MKIHELRYGSRTVGACAVAALLGLTGTAAADCRVTSRTDAAETYTCSRYVDFVARNEFSRVTTQYIFQDLSGDIRGRDLFVLPPVFGLFEQPAVALYDADANANSDLSIMFDGGPYGTDARGIGLAVVNRGADGEKGRDRNKADDGKPGAKSGPASIVVKSGTISSVFDTNYPYEAAAISAAILAESWGGRGGNGGRGIQLTFNKSRGGDGGAGGDGSNVSVTVAEGVAVRSKRGIGVAAQSIGGDGGNGGRADGSFTEARGGDGGRGGTGGEVTIDVAGSVEAGGIGIGARSLGGAGGNGGEGASARGRGGAGAGSGPGGKVDVTLSGSVATTGKDSTGVVAQSVGGFSGTGGSGFGWVGYGASSESAGRGGRTTLTLGKGSSIVTSGKYADGAIAQSIGGGGGVGGHGVGLKSLGGAGSAGGAGGKVIVSSAASIETRGEGASALTAASIGGGGGQSGSSVGIVALGGKGGSGGDGGFVNVTNSGALSTSGKDADGINAVSIGGGGGLATATGGIVSIGARGGKGGNGNDVAVQNSGNITTRGAMSNAFYLASIGGGGGTGAAAWAAGPIFAMAMGGDGGNGGNGGNVEYRDIAGNTDTMLSTSGVKSIGLAAQSVGGGGGTGGGTVSAAVGTKFSVSLGIGSDGGKGGNAGSVDIDTSAGIETKGLMSAGISALATGGGGGDSGTILTKAKGVVSFALGLGGQAGNGGDGGKVRVASGGAITTHGALSNGITAQSVGGGGGNAEATSTASLGISKLSTNMSLGTSGGAGGDGAAVDVAQSGAVRTQGVRSRAILAQSIGGGGGNGSVAKSLSLKNPVSLAFVMGGTGGTGGNGANVSVKSGGTLTTSGLAAGALLAQSVGGGGGAGGNTIQGDVLTSLNISAGLGGTGGVGGTGGAVNVSTGGAISTEGKMSPGVIAQSVGGGGGVGGNSITASPLDILSVAVNLGGDGGNGGTGGTVNYDNSAGITTKGDGSTGVLAQSLGGGGGVSGQQARFSVAQRMSIGLGSSDGTGNDGGNVTARNADGLIETEGDNAQGLVAQSIGGGGGISILDLNGNVDTIDVSLGSTKGRGEGGAVVAENAGRIATAGAESYGLLAQSIGGGGGAIFSQIRSADTNLAVGGTGSAGGSNSGTVNVTNSGTIVTSGDEAAGIVAQSIAGGGGLAPGAMLAFGAKAADLNVGVGVGGAEHGFAPVVKGSQASARKVAVTAGDIRTQGMAAHGVVAQSVGGSGGIGTILDAAGNVAHAMAGSAGGTRGNGGDVSVTADGMIAVNGEEAHGIIAQSASGADLSSGRVTVDVIGSVAANGKNGRAILAQSEGGNANKRIAIKVAEGGSVFSAAEARSAILLLDGADNTIVNKGTVEKAGSFASGSDENYAILALGDAATTVTNTGRLSGATAGADLTIDNMDGAVMELGRTSDLGVGSLKNAGILTAGQRGRIRRVRIAAANVTQSQGGTILVDNQLGDGIDVDAAADMIVIDGDASLAGTVRTDLVGVNLVQSGTAGEVAFLKSVGNRADVRGLAVEDTATVDYSLVETTGSGESTYGLAYTVDYTPWDGDTGARAAGIASASVGAQSAKARTASIGSDVDLGNATRFGGYLGALVNARLGERAAIAAGTMTAGTGEYRWVEDLMGYILEIDDIASLLTNYELMIPNVHSAPLDATMLSSIDFADALLACSASPQATGAAVVSDGVSCAWAKMQGNYLRRGETNRTLGYEEASFGLSAGLQAEIADGWSAGAGISYESANLSADYISSGHGDRLQAGVFLEKDWNAWTFGAGVTGGFGAYDIDRLTRTPGGLAKAHSDTTIGFVSAHARIARAFDMGGFSLTPQFDAGLHHQWRPGFSETGAGAYGVRIAAYDETALTLSPEVEVATELALGGATARLFARAGLLGVIADDRVLEATFTGVPGGGPTLNVTDDPDRLFGKLALGIDATLNDDWSLKLEGKSLIGSDQQALSGSLRLEYRF
ncbi:hypothetical protein RDV64_14755 [Acuticoccus sp. MNP-M23]|uniref:hypothetical protein n=1 Tax=Acuticoccus sp. MNP-M23 TaxID=3072793 RepID=UPI00281648EE|nr:hypothetical protein [Acuticoccus sp. MNP-M23]WMS41336.1 hypothetical protein RDV64_14755 [Acuticoccus sp. MNP-M23]